MVVDQVKAANQVWVMDVRPRAGWHGYPILVLNLVLRLSVERDVYCKAGVLVDLYEKGQLTRLLTWACGRVSPADVRHGLEQLPWSYLSDEVELPG